MSASIRQWLEELGLPQYADAFEANDIDMSLLSDLTDGFLKELGVASVGHRVKLLKAIAGMHARAAPELPSRPIDEGPSVSGSGERRHATVLFSDLSGYTAMNERLDPEEVRSIMGRIKAEAVRIVEANGGIVNQFVGDEVLALFGVPAAHEDDPVRAVRAALDLHAAVRAMSAELQARIGAPLRLHTGISTGLIVTGTEDRRDGTYGITGDTVNIGARLAHAAEPDAVLASEETQRTIADYFRTEALPAVELKGKGARVTPYRVIERTGVSSRFEAAAQRGFTAYAGRAAELRALHEASRKTQAGQGQFVTVMGEPGIGKSRLLFEFRHSLPGEQMTVLTGYCQSYGADTPYLPLVEALRRGLRLERVTSPRALHDQAVAAVQAVSPALERYLPQYLHLLSIPSETYKIPATLQGDALRRSFEEANAAILTENARHRPMVLILEDWHWADEASESALKHLSGLIAHHPLMVVLTYRPEYERNWVNPQGYHPLVLQPLGEADTAAMLRAVWKTEALPDGLAVQIHAHTGGNALFNEEVARALVEDGVVRIEQGRAALRGTFDTLHLPETVHAVIRARVDRLDSEAGEVLRLASVIGREFALPVLEKLHPLPGAIPAALDALVRQDLVHPRRVVPEATWLFKHALVQDVVYDTLLLSRRRTLHEQTGAAIEALYARRLEEHYEALADHYSRSENAEKAVQYLDRAGDKAVQKFSLGEARRLYDRAVSRIEREPSSEMRRSRIRVALKWGEISSGQPTPSLLVAFERAAEDAASLNEKDLWANLQAWRAERLKDFGKVGEARAIAHEIIALRDQLGDQSVVGIAHYALALMSFWNDCDFAESQQQASLASRLLLGSKHLFQLGFSQLQLGLDETYLGRFPEGEESFRAALESAKLEPAQTIQVWWSAMRGFALNARGEWGEAQATFHRGIPVAAAKGDVWPLAWMKIGAGFTGVMSAEKIEGAALIEQGIGELKATGIPLGLSLCLALYAQVQAIRGERQKALDACQTCRELAHMGDIIGSPLADVTSALIAASGEPPEFGSAESLIGMALQQFEKRQERPQIAIAHLRCAEILHKKGDLPAAGERLARAERLFAEMNMAWWSEQALQLRARVEGGEPFTWYVPYVKAAPPIT